VFVGSTISINDTNYATKTYTQSVGFLMDTSMGNTCFDDPLFTTNGFEFAFQGLVTTAFTPTLTAATAVISNPTITVTETTGKYNGTLAYCPTIFTADASNSN